MGEKKKQLTWQQRRDLADLKRRTEMRKWLSKRKKVDLVEYVKRFKINVKI